MRRLLTATTIAAALCGTAVLGAAPSGAAPTVDVDPIALSTSRVSFTGELTWEKVVYQHENRDLGTHVPTAINLTPGSCASLSISWFDGGDASTASSVMNTDLGCASITDFSVLYTLQNSRLNVPPAMKAKVCVTSRPKLGLDRPQTACAIAFPFIDRSTGI